jgi:hypothetical protein
VSAHRDSSFGAEPPGGQDGEQPDRPVPDDGDGLSWLDVGGDGAEPARAQSRPRKLPVRQPKSGKETRVSNPRRRPKCPDPPNHKRLNDENKPEFLTEGHWG